MVFEERITIDVELTTMRQTVRETKPETEYGKGSSRCKLRTRKNEREYRIS